MARSGGVVPATVGSGSGDGVMAGVCSVQRVLLRTTTRSKSGSAMRIPFRPERSSVCAGDGIDGRPVRCHDGEASATTRPSMLQTGKAIGGCLPDQTSAFAEEGGANPCILIQG